MNLLFSSPPVVGREGSTMAAPATQKDASFLVVPYNATVKTMLAALERNLFPDAVIRRLIRLLLALPRSSSSLAWSSSHDMALQEMPIAVDANKAKWQHYEVPTSFFKLVLSRNLKYSFTYLQLLLSKWMYVG